MGQDQVNKNKPLETGKLGVLKDQIKDALAQPIAVEQEQKEKRTVKLVIMNSHCGCGMFNFDIERDVDFDSPLQDGDGIQPEDYLPTDRLI